MNQYDVMLKKRLAALEELYLCEKAGEVITLVKTSKNHGISPGKFVSALRGLKVITGGRGNVRWCTGEPDEVMAKAVLAFERNNTDFSSGVKEESDGKLGLALVIEATELGVNYSLTGKRLESFVKDVINLVKRNKG